MYKIFEQLLCAVLIGLILCPPALAGGIQVDAGAPAANQASMSAAGNGVPVVNIVQPNGGGVSHNKFTDFNVAKQGVIINNSNMPGVTQLGGVVANNPNFTDGRKASIILNEVTSTNRSLLQGYTEVFGGGHYILANPNGVTIDGGGFIGTPRATVTTGVPSVNGGNVMLGVTGGDVLIQGDGINAKNIDAFEIVSRTAQINADIHANRLKIVAGKSNYNPTTGEVTEVAPNGDPLPAVVIDSTALGGMYAGRINLIGTEKGVGVNLEGITQSTEDLQITAQGTIEIKNKVGSGGNLAIASQEESVNVTGTVTAANTATLSAKDTVLIAKSDPADAALVKAGTINISGGKLDNQHLIAADSHFAIASDEVVNTGTIYSGGTGAFHVSGTVHNNRGAILTKGDMTLEGASAGQKMTKLQNDSATIESLESSLAIRAHDLKNNNLDFQLVEGATELSRLDGVYQGGDDNWKTYVLFQHYVGRSYAGPSGWTAYPMSNSYIKLDPSVNVISSEDLSAHFAELEQKCVENPNFLNSTDKYYISIYKQIIAQGYKYFIAAHGQTNGVIFSERVTHDSVTGADKGSLIAASGNVNIQGDDVQNIVSTISSAAGDITIDTNTFTNEGQDVYERTFVTWGRAAFHSHRSPNIEYKGGGTIPHLKAIDHVYGSIDAGNKVTINAAHVDNGIVERNGVLQAPDTAAQQQKVADVTKEFPAGLTVVNTAPDHPYLIETNPALTNLSGYIGGEFLLEQIGTTEEGLTEKLLLDPYLTVQEVKKKVLDGTGRRFLEDSIKSDAEQVKHLMENALAAKESLGLSLGIALSKEQIIDLDKDIVWLVEEEVQGQKVLVPKVYLGQGSVGRIAQGGAVIAGKNVEINAANVSNSGLILAEGNTVINAENIFNHRGTIQAQEVALTATDTITNTGGFIKGADVALKAENDVVLTADMYDSQLQETSSRIIASKGSVEATNSLNIVAGRDVEMSGSGVKSDSGASIQAGRNVAVSTVETHTKASMNGDNFSSRTNISTSQGSTIDVAGNLELKAEQDIIVHGSGVAAQGDVNLQAEENVSITSATNEVDLYSHADDAGGMFGGSKSSTFEQRESSNVASVITSGGNTNIKAGSDTRAEGDLAVIGSRVSTEGDLDMQATGEIIIASAEEEAFSHSQSSKSGMFSSKSETKRTSSTTQVGSDIESAGSVTATAKQDLNISASNIYGQEAVTLTSEEGNVNIVAAQNESSSYEKKESKKVGLFASDGRLDYARMKEKMESNDESDSIGSSVVSDKDITVTAQNDAVVVGSDLSAGGNIIINAGRDANVLSGRNEKKTKKFEKQAGLGIGFKFTEDEISVSSGLKATEKKEEFSGSYNAKSTLSAGEDVTITAGQNVNQVSSDIEAGQDVALKAGGDVKTEAAHDIEKHDSYVKEIEVGVKAAAKQNVTGALRTVAGLPKTMTAGKGNSAAKAATAASAAMKAYGDVSSAVGTTVSASITGGASYTESKESSESKTAVGSNTSAGRNVTIEADKDITVDGGRIVANEDVTIKAREDVNINSAKNTYESSSSTTNVDARGGIGGSIGAGGMSAGVTVSASLGGSENDSEAETNDNGEVTAGEILTVESGKDTTIEGANLSGKEVAMNVGENLVVRSVQDTASAKGNNYSVGGSATVGMGVNVSANVGYGENKSESKWVDQQTSIIGKEKVDIYTGKNTHVEGAIIAAENDNLVLNTETLTYKDIHDSDTSESFNAAVSGSVGFGGTDKGDGKEQEPGEGQGTGDDQPGDNQQGETGTDQSGEKKDSEQTKKDDSTIPGTASGDYSSKDKEQINRATIGKGTIIIRSDPDAGLEGLNRDLAKAQEITKDSETVVKVYVDPATIKDIASGGKALQENAEKLVEQFEKIVDKIKEALPENAKKERDQLENQTEMIQRLMNEGIKKDEAIMKSAETAEAVNIFLELDKLKERERNGEEVSPEEYQAVLHNMSLEKSYASISIEGDNIVYQEDANVVGMSLGGLYMGIMSSFSDTSKDITDTIYDLSGAIVYEQTGYKGCKDQWERANKTALAVGDSVAYAITHPLKVGEALVKRVEEKWNLYQKQLEDKDYYGAYFTLGGLVPDAVEVGAAAYTGGVGVFKAGSKLSKMTKASYKLGKEIAEGLVHNSKRYVFELAKKYGDDVVSNAGDFFAGTQYTSKVQNQMNAFVHRDPFHQFPEIVKNHQDMGIVRKIKGGDGIERLQLEIPGEYLGKKGVFEFMKEANGNINHRLFRQIKEWNK
ncbi:hemagglutinin repeat-containing protein [Salidesulfovibrio onnuriiensis]|uniref:hemagglutinin repeat-containing protein n=1 Tax=Salidesulfovibrio onnuriiensis TaxID=2583823 RepID=UPI0011C6EC05|nr:hemagglutinin repeat-containing protein [Salidesulfovibrio onnuriiensis]